ncbi:MAG: site-specific integrase [archaeon]
MKTKYAQDRGENKPFTCSKKKLPYVPTREEILKLLAYADDVRLGFSIFVSVFQGLRIGETAKLKWSNVDLINGEIRIIDGKNTRRYKSGYGKDRIVPINEMFLYIWKAWRLMNPDQEYVLPSDDRFGVRADYKNIVRQIQKKLFSSLKKAELLQVDYYQKDGKPRYRYHTHSFRHVCGTNLRRAGMRIEDIRDFLGHDDIDTTQVYTELTKDDLREVSHTAYAYPKSSLGLPKVEISVDKETLLLQREIIEKQLELAKMQMIGKREVEIYADM